MKRNGQTLLETMRQVRRKRRWVQPNVGFVRVLRRWEKELFRRGTISRMPYCDLCEMKRETKWFAEDPKGRWLVVECNQCDQPMAVWRAHTLDLTPEESDELETALKAVADRFFGGRDRYYVDKKQRTISTHLHWHAREHTHLSLFIQQQMHREPPMTSSVEFFRRSRSTDVEIKRLPSCACCCSRL